MLAHLSSHAQSFSLLDLAASVERCGDKPDNKNYILSLVNKHNVCVFRCHIDPTTRGAGHFEEELREMMATVRAGLCACACACVLVRVCVCVCVYVRVAHALHTPLTSSSVRGD
jgi:hypothetical protein